MADEDISDKQVQFTEAAEKSEIESGDTLGTICGKVKKSLAEIANINDNILLKAYPVGAVYFSVSETNPGELFGGTWARWGLGRVVMCVGENGTTT